MASIPKRGERARHARQGRAFERLSAVEGLRPRAILVGLALKRFYRTVRPSPERLAELTHLSRATVYEALDELEAAGLIRRKEVELKGERKAARGRAKTAYDLHF